MNEQKTTEQLDYESAKRMEAEESAEHYTPRPKHHIILAWILLAVVLFAIGGMCYWEIFGKF